MIKINDEIYVFLKQLEIYLQVLGLMIQACKEDENKVIVKEEDSVVENFDHIQIP
jgi:hypothetical protein